VPHPKGKGDVHLFRAAAANSLSRWLLVEDSTPMHFLEAFLNISEGQPPADGRANQSMVI
jgi:hypothetical protein